MQLIKVFTFLFLLFVYSNSALAEAGSNYITINPDGSFSADILENTHTSNNMGSSYFLVFKNVSYPSTGDGGSGVSGGAPSVTIEVLIEALGFTLSGDTITGNIQTFLTSVGYGTGDGTFWMQLKSTPAGVNRIDSWYNLTRTGGIWTTETVNPADYKTRLVSATVSGVSTSTNFSIDYYLQTSEFTNENRPDAVSIYISNADTTLITSKNSYLYPLSDGFHNENVVINNSFSDGTYTAWITFWNVLNNDYTFKKTQLVVNFTLSGGVVVSSTVVEQSDGLIGTVGEPYDPDATACDNFVLGPLCSIASFLFIPGPLSTTMFTDVLDSFDTKKPFSYFSQVTGIISTIASSSSASTEFVDLTITLDLPPISGIYPILTKTTLDSIYDTPTRLLVRDVISYGLWVIFSLSLLYMLLNIFNRAVYLGEQGNDKTASSLRSFNNRVKSKHE